MAGPHHFVHLVMKLSAEAVRTRMPSGASPHHRIVSEKSGIGVEPAARILRPLDRQKIREERTALLLIARKTNEKKPGRPGFSYL